MADYLAMLWVLGGMHFRDHRESVWPSGVVEVRAARNIRILRAVTLWLHLRLHLSFFFSPP